MKFTQKNLDLTEDEQSWRYENQLQRSKIRTLLLKEQMSFCAYSEKYLSQIDTCEIDHFDPRLKGTLNDGYPNWYAVLSWVNQHKPKKLDDRYLPILEPSSKALQTRIFFEANLYHPTDAKDEEAKHLIEFLGLNRPELAKERVEHIKRLKQIRSLCGEDAAFLTFLQENKSDLSFLTAIEKAFGLQASFEAEGVALRPLLPSTPKEEERLEPTKAILPPQSDGKTEETS